MRLADNGKLFWFRFIVIPDRWFEAFTSAPFVVALLTDWDKVQIVLTGHGRWGVEYWLLNPAFETKTTFFSLCPDLKLLRRYHENN
jgi:hypothetical protein